MSYFIGILIAASGIALIVLGFWILWVVSRLDENDNNW